MQFSLISSFVVMAVIVAIGNIDASPTPTDHGVSRVGRSADGDILEALNIIDEAEEHYISKRSPERVVINYQPPPPNGPRHARSASGKNLDDSSSEETKEKSSEESSEEFKQR